MRLHTIRRGTSLYPLVGAMMLLLEDGCSANVTVSSQVEPVEKPYVDNPATVLSPP